MGEGGDGLGLLSDVLFCLQVEGPITPDNRGSVLCCLIDRI